MSRACNGGNQPHFDLLLMFVSWKKHVALVVLLALVAGCGTSKSRLATEQLLMSDAVDRTVAKISFRPLAGKRVYFDSQYIKAVKGVGFVNSDYVISSLRQQLVASGVLLEDDPDDAEFIVEARIGALGIDGHEIVYGIPASNALSSAASLLPNSPPLPAIPEISVAKRLDERGAAKIGIFAYHAKTREPVWQSGISVATSNARDAWVFGAGPWQFGTIYDEPQFAGSALDLSLASERDPEAEAVSYYQEIDFQRKAKERKRREETRNKIFDDLRNIGEIPDLLPLSHETLEQPLDSRLPQPTSELPTPSAND